MAATRVGEPGSVVFQRSFLPYPDIQPRHSVGTAQIAWWIASLTSMRLSSPRGGPPEELHPYELMEFVVHDINWQDTLAAYIEFVRKGTQITNTPG